MEASPQVPDQMIGAKMLWGKCYGKSRAWNCWPGHHGSEPRSQPGITRVAVYNRTRQRTDELMADHGGEGDFRPASSLDELVRALARPRAILLMVKAGSPVDEAIESLSKLLEPGDLIIDGGNSLFHDTRRRARAA